MDHKKRSASSAGLYGAIAVCVLAAGIGTWQLLRRETAPTGPAAVSGPARIEAASNPELEPEAEAEAAAKPSAPRTTPQTPDSAQPSKTDPAQPSAPADTSKADSAASPDSASGGKTNTSTNTPNSANSRTSGSANSTNSTGSGKSDAPAKTSSGSGTATTPAPAAAPAPSNDTAAVTEAAMSLPVDGETVTVFAMDRLLYNETLGDWRTHDGIDIAADPGTAVLAAADGMVESVKEDAMMGTTVTVRHEGDLETVYACLESGPEVEAGEQVFAGQVLGYVGSGAGAEASLVPHLHFSVLDEGAAVDPEDYFRP